MERVTWTFEHEQGALEKCLKELSVLLEEYNDYDPYSDFISKKKSKSCFDFLIYQLDSYF